MALLEELNKGLSDRIEQIVTTHFPNAKKQGSSWRMGDLDGTPGGSTGIFRGRGGIYMATDNATGDSLNILQLFHRKIGGSWHDTLAEAKKVCGIRDVQPAKKIKPPKISPIKGNIRGTDALKYLNERGIKEDTCAKYHIKEVNGSDLPSSKLSTQEKYIAFPFTTPEGKGAMYKWLGLERPNGKKDTRSTYPQYATLFGWRETSANTTEIIITEGEIDCLSVAQMKPGLPVLSMPCGASNLNWIDNDYERLETLETIFLLTDMDDAGEQAAQKIAKRLGAARCRRVSLPDGYKDANDYLLSKEHGKPSITELMEKAKTYDPPEMMGSDDLASAAIQRGEELTEALKDKNFLFPTLPFKLLPKDTGILTGYIGHGKTDCANNIMLNEVRTGETVCVFACDTPADDLLRLCAWQMVGHEPSPIEIESCAERLKGHFYFVDGVEHEQSTQSILDNMEYAVRRFGVTRFLIDNLSEIADIRKDDYDGQGRFVRKLDKFDKTHGTNTMLVAHSLMGNDCDWKIPGRRDVEGDKGMVKPLQYGISIFRNKVKEKPDEFDEGSDTSKRIQKLLDGEDAYISIWKQRNGFREEFIQGLRFHKSARWYALPFEKFSSPLPIYPSEQKVAEVETKQEINSEYFG